MRQGQTLTVVPTVGRQDEISLIKLREKVKKLLEKWHPYRLRPSPDEIENSLKILDRILQMGCNYDWLAEPDLGF